MKNLLLTHGNIRKSKKLRHYFLDFGDERFQKDLAEYFERIKSESEFLKIYDKLHDSKFKIIEERNKVIFDLNLAQSGEAARLIFDGGKIVSFNSVKQNGHISRLNKNVIAQEYGYEDIYSEFGKNIFRWCFLLRKAKARALIKSSFDNPIQNVTGGKMKKLILISSFLCCVIFAACQKQIDFDAQKWQKGKRRYQMTTSLIAKLDAEKPNKNEVLSLLGRPALEERVLEKEISYFLKADGFISGWELCIYFDDNGNYKSAEVSYFD